MEMCYNGALVMPSSYAVMDEEEMTYVEGGWKKVTKWYGKGIKLSGKETSQFLSDSSWLAIPICALYGGFGSKVAGIIAAGIIGMGGYTISRMNKDNSGVTFMWNWTQLNLAPGYKLPVIIDN